MEQTMSGAVEFLRDLSVQGIRLSVEGGGLKCYAPRGLVTDVVRSGIRRHRAEILALFATRKRVEARPAMVREFPLSQGQRGLFLLHELEVGMSSYNVPLCLRLGSSVRVEALSRAWAWVQDRHPILTARVIENDGVLSQVLDEGCRTSLALHWREQESEGDLLSWLRDRAREPFDLRRGPLTRADLLLGGENGPVLLLTVHHLVFDGSSALLVLRALVEYYGQICAGRSRSQEPVGPGYEAFVAWEGAMLSSAEGLGHGEYWERQLSGMLPILEILPNVRRGESRRGGARLVQDLPEELHGWVQGYGAAHRLAPSVIFLGVFQLLLYRYTGQDDIVVGMPVMGRTENRFAAEVGYYVNMMPLRTRFLPSLRVSESLLALRSTMLDGLYHSSYPFPLMVEKLSSRPSGHHPVFQVAYAYQNFVREEDFASLSRQDGFSLEVVSGVSQEGDFDFALEVFEKERSVSLHLKYNPALYSEATAQGFLGHYQALLREIRESPDRLAKEYAITTERERADLLTLSAGMVVPYVREVSVGEQIAEQVERRRSSLALIFGDERLSYGELYDRSVDLAFYLQSLGVGADSVVGLCLERSVEMMVGILGVELAGGAYLPLDPAYPDERLKYMLADSGAAVVLSQTHLGSRIGSLLEENVRHLRLDGEWGEVRDRAQELRAGGVSVRREAGPETLSYVIYTSGSTGRPKGVEVEHRALMNRLQWMQKRYKLEPGDVVLQKTPYSFDVSVWEFFWPLLEGATLVLAVPEGHKDVGYLEELIAREGVTTLHFVPSMLRVYLETARGQCGSVRRIFCSGEALDRRSVEQYRSRFPNAEMHNLYGPTEAAIDVTSFACADLEGEMVPIGRPIDNIQMHVLDEAGHLQPVGVPGELYIAGDGLARGYRNNPSLTAEKFVVNPFVAGTRMYRSGDLARWMEDGNLQYLGRIDTQVKLRGFRIELGEIEACLKQFTGIEDSVVVLRERGDDRQLVAFYRAKPAEPGQVRWLDVEPLRAHVGRHLPEYMIPAVYVSVTEVPLTASGKADRRALAAMEILQAGRGRIGYVAPGRETERRIVEIWAQLLGVEAEKIGIHDNFFELGGHSLLATQMQARLRSVLRVEVSLRLVFEKPTVAGLAEAVAGANTSRVPHIAPAVRDRELPLSFSQERLWFYEQFSPGTNRYNVPGAVVLRGGLNVDHLEEAMQYIVTRHEVLRTVFLSREGQARQQVLSDVRFRLRRVEMDEHDGGRDTRARELCVAEARSSFDLATGPLLRGMVITLSPVEHILMLNMHHIVSDGWSLRVLLGEIRDIMTALRQGREPELAPLPIQYADYSIWQRQWLIEGGVLQQQLEYWKQKLGGAPESLGMMTDYPRPAARSFAGAIYHFTLEEGLTNRLRELAEQQGATLFMVLVAAFKVLLHRYTGQRDLCLGTPIANRIYAETEGLIGMFVNSLVLRTTLEPGETFLDFLSKVKGTCLEAYENQDAPFEKVVEMLRPQRNLASNPLFQVMITLQNDLESQTTQSFSGLTIDKYWLDADSAKFDLSLDLTEVEHGLEGLVEYSLDLFQAQTIVRMMDHFAAICLRIADASTSEIRSLDFLSKNEKNSLRATDTTASWYPRELCLHDLFAQQVEQSGDKIAVRSIGKQMSYRELYERSRDLALHLQSLGVGPEKIVGLCMERSPEMIVALLAILQAGGAFMTLDPEYPVDRLAYMLADSRPEVIVTEDAQRAMLLACVGEGSHLVSLDDWTYLSSCASDLKRSGASLLVEVKPCNLAYLIYTSGSTGQPKGVAVEHRSVVNHNLYACQQYQIAREDKQLLVSSISFDLFVEEVFVILNSGAELIIQDKVTLLDGLSYGTVIRDSGVTVLNLPTALFHELVRTGANLAGLSKVIVGGEELAYSVALEFVTKYPHVALHNTYGPTEATIISTALLVTGELLQGRTFVPIGRAIANTQLYLLDEAGELQPMGAVGELHIAGDGLARGYLNRPELTREKFVANPFNPGTRMYKTGDLARWLEDGSLQYLGRTDHQVKLRGVRIELGEIEARLNQHPGIRESIVILQGEENGRRLVAFYRTQETEGDRVTEFTNDELWSFLMATLPTNMIPTAFMSLASLPLSVNGKIDRKALERMDVQAGPPREFAGPRNGTERRLVEIWAEVLGSDPEKIGVHDDFFEIGGHSLAALPLMAKIQKQFGKSLALASLVTNPTIASIALLLSSADPMTKFEVVVPVQSGGDGPPVFGVPGAGGNVLSLRFLSASLGTQRPFYGLQAVGLDGEARPLESVEETAWINLEAIQKIQASGPYTFIGHSYGGAVAYEMVRLLQQRGEDVSLLVLLDSISPPVVQRTETVEEATGLSDVCRAVGMAYGTSVDLDAGLLRGASQEERVGYAVDALRARGVEFNSDTLAAYYRVYCANVRCYHAYHPEPLPSPVHAVLFRVEETFADERVLPRDYGWSDLLGERLCVQPMDADHFSILERVDLQHLFCPAALSISAN